MRKIILFFNILSIAIIVLIAFYIIDMRNKAQEEQGTSPPIQKSFSPTASMNPSATPKETSSPPTVNQVQVYLTAIGDEGQTGEEFGCQDSIVPVQLDITPTTQPLHAAIRRLLEIDQYYGQSGLYNALYQSDLEIQSIALQDGHATIELTGSLVSGGVCDDPRIEEQLRRTALDFSTVDSVSIIINGEEL